MKLDEKGEGIKKQTKKTLRHRQQYGDYCWKGDEGRQKKVCGEGRKKE